MNIYRILLYNIIERSTSPQTNLNRNQISAILDWVFMTICSETSSGLKPEVKEGFAITYRTRLDLHWKNDMCESSQPASSPSPRHDTPRHNTPSNNTNRHIHLGIIHLFCEHHTSCQIFIQCMVSVPDQIFGPYPQDEKKESQIGKF